MKRLDEMTLAERVAFRRVASKSPIWFIRAWFWVIAGRKLKLWW